MGIFGRVASALSGGTHGRHNVTTGATGARDSGAAERAKLLRRDSRPLAWEDLETGVPGLPVADGPHLAWHVLSADVDAGTTFEARTEWHATQGEADTFARQLGRLEDALSDATAGAGVPALRTEVGRVPDEREGGGPVDGPFVKLVVNPPTPTGRAPRYPVDILFGAESGSHGAINYLRDGRPGKADVTYCGRSVTYRAAWRMSGGSLLPSRVCAIDLKTGAETTIWRA